MQTFTVKITAYDKNSQMISSIGTEECTMEEYVNNYSTDEKRRTVLTKTLMHYKMENKVDQIHRVWITVENNNVKTKQAPHSST